MQANPDLVITALVASFPQSGYELFYRQIARIVGVRVAEERLIRVLLGKNL